MVEQAPKIPQDKIEQSSDTIESNKQDKISHSEHQIFPKLAEQESQKLTIDAGGKTTIYPRKDFYTASDISTATGIDTKKVSYYLRQVRRDQSIKPHKKEGNHNVLIFDETSFIELTKRVILEARKASLAFPDGEMVIASGRPQRELLEKLINAYNYEKGEWVSYKDFQGLALPQFNNRISSVRRALEKSGWEIVNDLLPGETVQGRAKNKKKNYLSHRLEKKSLVADDDGQEEAPQKFKIERLPDPILLSAEQRPEFKEAKEKLEKRRMENFENNLTFLLLSHLGVNNSLKDIEHNAYGFISSLLAENNLSFTSAINTTQQHQFIEQKEVKRIITYYIVEIVKRKITNSFDKKKKEETLTVKEQQIADSCVNILINPIGKLRIELEEIKKAKNLNYDSIRIPLIEKQLELLMEALKKLEKPNYDITEVIAIVAKKISEHFS